MKGRGATSLLDLSMQSLKGQQNPVFSMGI